MEVPGVPCVKASPLRRRAVPPHHLALPGDGGRSQRLPAQLGTAQHLQLAALHGTEAHGWGPSSTPRSRSTGILPSLRCRDPCSVAGFIWLKQLKSSPCVASAETGRMACLMETSIRHSCVSKRCFGRRTNQPDIQIVCIHALFFRKKIHGPI